MGIELQIHELVLIFEFLIKPEMKVKKLFCIVPGIKKNQLRLHKGFQPLWKTKKNRQKKVSNCNPSKYVPLQAQIEKQKLNSNKVHKMPFLYILCKKINSAKCSYETAN